MIQRRKSLRAAALTALVCLSIQATAGGAVAAPAKPDSKPGLLSIEEEREREAFRRELAALGPLETKDGTLASLLNASLPGAGSYYVYENMDRALGVTALAGALDAAALGGMYLSYMGSSAGRSGTPSFTSSAQFATGLLGIGLVHLLIGLVTAAETTNWNRTKEQEWTLAKSRLDRSIAELERTERARLTEMSITIGSAKTLVAAGDYAAGLRKLRGIKGPIGEHPQVLSLLKDWEARVGAQNVQRATEALAQAATLAARGKYVQAVATLDRAPGGTAREGERTAALESYRQRAVTEALKTAAQLASSGRHGEGIGAIWQLPASLRESSNVKKTVGQYLGAALARGQKLAAQADYASAVKTLEAVPAGARSPELTARLAEYAQKAKGQPLQTALNNAAALARRGQYFRAMSEVYPFVSYFSQQAPASKAYTEYRAKADAEFDKTVLPLIGRGDAAGYHRKLAQYKQILGKNAGILPAFENRLIGASSGKLRTGRAVAGEALLIRARVETVTAGGLMLIDHGGLRVFVRGVPRLDVIDGDTVTIGGRYAGTTSYTTVSGRTATVRAITYTALIKKGY